MTWDGEESETYINMTHSLQWRQMSDMEPETPVTRQFVNSSFELATDKSPRIRIHLPFVKGVPHIKGH